MRTIAPPNAASVDTLRMLSGHFENRAELQESSTSNLQQCSHVASCHPRPCAPSCDNAMTTCAGLFVRPAGQRSLLVSSRRAANRSLSCFGEVPPPPCTIHLAHAWHNGGSPATVDKL